VNTSCDTSSRRARRWTTLAIAVILAGLAPWVIGRLRGHAGETGLEDLRYRFERTARGTITAALEREIAFYQTRITRDPQGGLDLASLAGSYLRMARATGDLSWYVLADQAARRSLANLPFQNDSAILALAKIAEVRHDFKEAIRLAEGLRAHQDGLGILVTAHLAIGDVETAGRAAEELVRRLPTLGSLTLRALVSIARGADAAAESDFLRAIAARRKPGRPAARHTPERSWVASTHGAAASIWHAHSTRRRCASYRSIRSRLCTWPNSRRARAHIGWPSGTSRRS